MTRAVGARRSLRSCLIVGVVATVVLALVAALT